MTKRASKPFSNGQQIYSSRYQDILMQFRSRHKLTQPSKNSLSTHAPSRPPEKPRDPSVSSFSHFPNIDMFSGNNTQSRGGGTDLNKKTRSKSEPSLFPTLLSKAGPEVRSFPGSPNDRFSREFTHGSKAEIRLPRFPLAREVRTTSYSSSNARGSEKRKVEDPISNRQQDLKKAKDGDIRLQHQHSKNRDLPDKHKRQSPQKAAGSKIWNESELPFSVRKKIEEYRKWHEEQFREKLDLLKKDSNKEHQDGNAASALPVSNVLNKNSSESRANEISTKDATGRLVELPDRQQDIAVSGREQSRGASPPAPIPDELKYRQHSAKTWRTWRNVNDSYAYSNVHRYLKENELMTSEKEDRIKRWISDVHISQRPDSSDEDDY